MPRDIAQHAPYRFTLDASYISTDQSLVFFASVVVLLPYSIHTSVSSPESEPKRQDQYFIGNISQELRQDCTVYTHAHRYQTLVGFPSIPQRIISCYALLCTLHMTNNQCTCTVALSLNVYRGAHRGHLCRRRDFWRFFYTRVLQLQSRLSQSAPLMVPEQ